MKMNILFISLACIIGMLIGSWEPHAKIRALEKALAEKSSKNRNRENRFGDIASFARLANMPENATRRRRSSSRSAGRAAAPAVNAISTNVVASSGHDETAATNSPPPVMQSRRKRNNPFATETDFESAREVWMTRANLLRSQWKTKLKMDEALAANFDAQIDEMNARLLEIAKTSADILAQQKRMTQELGISMMGSIMTAIAETYDRGGEGLSPEMREQFSELPMHELIDPNSMMPMLDAFEAVADENVEQEGRQ